MQRTSARKVKLTSKFEEFTSARLQRSHSDHHRNSANDASPTKPEKVAKIERSETFKSAAPTKNDQISVKAEPEPSATITKQSAQVATPTTHRSISPKPTTTTPSASTTNTTTTTAQAGNIPITSSASSTHLTRDRATPKALRQKVVSTPVPPVSGYQTPSTTPTPYSQVTPLPKLTANGKVRGRPRKHILVQKAETVVKPISTTREELFRLREENASLRTQLEQKIAEYDELKRQSSYTGETVPKGDFDDLKEKYQRDLTHAKRREWCFLCLSPSRYYCCWNTTYCSQKCQVTDWYQRHMNSCERRKIKVPPQ